jgi:hypothetical protein
MSKFFSDLSKEGLIITAQSLGSSASLTALQRSSKAGLVDLCEGLAESYTVPEPAPVVPTVAQPTHLKGSWQAIWRTPRGFDYVTLHLPKLATREQALAAAIEMGAPR